MTKIPLFMGKSLGFDRYMVSMSVKYCNLPCFFTKAIVDTGCPYTIISESTLKKTRIPYNDKLFKCQVQLGNIPLELKELGICELQFRDENGNIIKFKQEIYVGIPIMKGYLAQELPSFIGKDLMDTNFISVINKKDGSSHLYLDD